MAALDLFAQFESLIKERNAVILTHYYQDLDIQGVADCIEDSLALTRQANRVEADVIRFHRVIFMCETAKIFNLGKRVIVTEPGIAHQLRKGSFSKTFIPLPSNDDCAYNEYPICDSI